jgi:hypothetical protein
VRRNRLLPADGGIRLLLAGLSAAALAALIGGLLLGPQAFLSNVLARVVDFSLGVLVTVLVVDALLERRRRRRWEAARLLTLRSIFVHIRDIAHALVGLVLAPLVEFDERMSLYAGLAIDTPSTGAANTIHRIAEFFTEHEPALVMIDLEEGERPRFPSLLSDLHKRIRDDLRSLREILAPRVLELGDDPELAESLFDIELADRRWRAAAGGMEANAGSSDEFILAAVAWGEVTALARALDVAVAHVVAIAAPDYEDGAAGRDRRGGSVVRSRRVGGTGAEAAANLHGRVERPS